mmetsp:Transcript_116469/g.336437  ORF Transcript_116469/g.336437 Transcript_116469/m.336437 type:complete len:131 (-) Transcript_116469:59-451(-)
MKFATVVTAVLLASVSALTVEQDPCAGCDEGLAQAHQECVLAHGNACAERGEGGIVGSGPGTKKDVGCCLKKQKHTRCLECKSMDCEFKTCNVNKKYYSERTLTMKAKESTKEAYTKFDKKAMTAAGWSS